MAQYTGPSTQCIHQGEAQVKPCEAITTPIAQCATFPFENTQQICDFFNGLINRNEEYGRYGNPTQRVAEQKLAELDNGEMSLLCSSGMAAITTTLLALLDPGTHVIFTNDCYKKTRQFATDLLDKFKVPYTLVEPVVDKIAAAIQPNTKLIYSESPTNPYLNVIDLKAVANLARQHNIITIIDATFATPYNQKPLTFGIDLVIHACTKYLGGHNDLIAGVITGRRDLVTTIKDYHAMLGPIPSPMTAYLLIRGLKTFALRMERHNYNGLEVARFLEHHPKIEQVFYPGLESHPHHTIARDQMKGYGGVVSCILKADRETTSRFVDNLKLFYITPSFGGPESLVSQPSIMTFFDLDESQRKARGINDSLVRLSVGLEDSQDILTDLTQALDSI